MKKPNPRRVFSLIIRIAPIIIGLFAFLYGQKILHPRPRLIVQYNIKQFEYSGNSADLRERPWERLGAMMDELSSITRGMKLEINKERYIVKWANKHISRLREIGISPQNFVKLFKLEGEKKREDYDIILEKSFTLQQRKKLRDMSSDMIADMGRELPLQTVSTALSKMRKIIRRFTIGYRIEYKVKNVGKKEASHVIIKINPGSAILLADNPCSENTIQRFETKNTKTVLIELNSLSPNCSVEGEVWCPSVKNKVPISVSFEEGKVEIKKSSLFSQVALWYNIIMPFLVPILMGIIIMLTIVVIVYRKEFKKIRYKVKHKRKRS